MRVSRIRILLSLLLTFAIGAAFSSIVAIAWTGPTGTAPNNNVSAPLNTGSTDQIKSAGLSLNSLVVFGNTLLSGFGTGVGRYLNFDYTSGGTSGTGANGYGIRDNNGTLQFKNSGGSWQNMTATSSTFSQVHFADGSTQTTAAATTTGFTSCTQVRISGTYHASGSCPAGYTLTGGGCEEDSGAPLLTCQPTSATSWECVDQNAGLCTVTLICCH